MNEEPNAANRTNGNQEVNVMIMHLEKLWDVWDKTKDFNEYRQFLKVLSSIKDKAIECYEFELSKKEA